ncbi:MAG: hypothetical protein NTZ49_02835, partial [Candidatus Parcubacteria bacterium]|nr:hypothetical protein [Candidatus Parcubacteria bacterium]
KDTLSKQLGVELPVDPLNIMARTAIKCTVNDDCGQGQCSGGYCSQCPVGYDPKTCWNERDKKYFDVDGYIYRFYDGQLSFRYEYPEIVLPTTGGELCILGCLRNEVFYEQGKCINKDNVYCNATNCFCDAGSWQPNECGDGIIRCGEACEGVKCLGCRTCETGYHAIVGKCESDKRVIELNDVSRPLAETGEQIWLGDNWSASQVISCKDHAILDSDNVCHCQSGYYEDNGSCLIQTKTWTCPVKPAVGTDWNTVSSYEQVVINNAPAPPDDNDTNFDEIPSTQDCRYKCAEGYYWNEAECVLIPEIPAVPITQNFYCTGLPTHARWNWLNSYLQTYDVTSWEPPDSLAIFSEDVTDVTNIGCHYVCEYNFDWDDVSDTCVAQIRTQICQGTLPANAAWNPLAGQTGGQYIQTWDSDTTSWLPADVAASFSTTSGNCHYNCVANFDWDDLINTCVAQTRTQTCQGTLPANTVWNPMAGQIGGQYIQTWDIGTNSWLPLAVNTEYGITAGDCIYKCAVGSYWDGDSCEIAVCGDGIIASAAGEVCDDGASNNVPGYCNDTCTAILPSSRVTDCGIYPIHTVPNGPTSYTQNWVEEFEAWEPNNNYLDLDYNVTDACHYKCAPDLTGYNGYYWKNSACVLNTCGDAVIASETIEICDDGSNNGKAGYCDSTCTGFTGFKTPMYVDNFEDPANMANWTQGACPTGSTCSWSRYYLTGVTGNYKYKSTNTGTSLSETWVSKSGMSSLRDIDVFAMIDGASVEMISNLIYTRFQPDLSRPWMGTYYSLYVNNNMQLKWIQRHTYNGFVPIVQVFPSAIISSGKYWLRLRVHGTSSTVLDAKWWPVGTAMPSTWQMSGTDSSVYTITSGGMVGLSGSNNNTIYFDNLIVYPYSATAP